MILADTSVWVDHFKRGNSHLAALLGSNRIVIHPFVIGELALGGLVRRPDALLLLTRLKAVGATPHDNVLMLVSSHRLDGAQIGWVDAHLLASCLDAKAQLWTLDKRLAATSRRLAVA